jgi:hypothetical protein
VGRLVSWPRRRRRRKRRRRKRRRRKSEILMAFCFYNGFLF